MGSSGEGQPHSDIPRRYYGRIDGDVCSYALRGFCDASTTVYAAVVYLVMKTRRTTHTQFIAARTRVAPLQTITIPRLELLSALLLSRLLATVSSALEYTLPDLEIECYTDSTLALYWIKGANKEWRPFVHNRVNEIRKTTSLEMWHHFPGVTESCRYSGMRMHEL